tara:strand:- start:160 stop:363 length:204 start_codon:yes stop_codon:yes gene_type:complete
MNITLESELQHQAEQKIEWNDRVYHSDYGYGTVFHIEDDMVDVMFDNIYYTKYLPKKELKKSLDNSN